MAVTVLFFHTRVFVLPPGSALFCLLRNSNKLFSHLIVFVFCLFIDYVLCYLSFLLLSLSL